MVYCQVLRLFSKEPQILKSEIIIFEAMITKSQIITALDQLPESMSIDQLIGMLKL